VCVVVSVWQGPCACSVLCPSLARSVCPLWHSSLFFVSVWSLALSNTQPFLPALSPRLFFFLFLSPAHARVSFPFCLFFLNLLSSISISLLPEPPLPPFSYSPPLPSLLVSSCLFFLKLFSVFSLLRSLHPVFIPLHTLSAPSLLSSLLCPSPSFLCLSTSLFSVFSLSFSNSSLFFFYFAFWTLFSPTVVLFSLFFQDCVCLPCTRSLLLGLCPSARSPPAPSGALSGPLPAPLCARPRSVSFLPVSFWRESCPVTNYNKHRLSTTGLD
ncbi:hypothetical protein NERG_00591, partial [Nematocida ausubeli]